MAIDPDAQRHRIGIAVAVTIIGVPAVWLIGDANDEAGSAATTAPTAVINVADDMSSTTIADPLGDPTSALVDREINVSPAGGAFIAIPRIEDSAAGRASFSYDITEPDLCHAAGAEPGRFVTVTNLDNSRSTTCIAAVDAEPGWPAVMMHPTTFAIISDPTEAPIPVEYRW